MTKDEMIQEIKRLESLVLTYQDAQVWYSTALEEMSKCRYHLSQILEKPHRFESDDVYTIYVNKKTLSEAEQALDEVNKHFSGK